MKRYRSRAAPFVVTLAACSIACGADVANEKASSAGVADGGSEAPIDSGGEDASDGGSETAIDSGDEDASTCVPAVMYESCNPSKPGCAAVQCASGLQSIPMVCGGQWYVDGLAPCALPYDHCENREMCVNGFWMQPAGVSTNPPMPCPEERPDGGCFLPDPDGDPLGYDQPFCGYPCDADGGAGWEVIACTGQWTSQGCNPIE